jgi:type I restriction enzyme S subunit
LDSEHEKAQGLIHQAQSAVSLLQERRSALISAAVTGQIDVRGLVPEAEAA